MSFGIETKRTAHRGPTLDLVRRYTRIPRPQPFLWQYTMFNLPVPLEHAPTFAGTKASAIAARPAKPLRLPPITRGLDREERIADAHLMGVGASSNMHAPPRSVCQTDDRHTLNGGTCVPELAPTPIKCARGYIPMLEIMRRRRHPRICGHPRTSEDNCIHGCPTFQQSKTTCRNKR